MNGSTRSLFSSLVVVTLLGIILVLLPLGAQGFAQSEEDHRAWLRSLDSLSSERMIADVRTLSGPSFNGRQAGSKDDLGSAYWVADQFLASKISLAFVPLDRIERSSRHRGSCQRSDRLHGEAISNCRHRPRTKSTNLYGQDSRQSATRNGFSPGARFTICACPCSDRVRRLWDCRYRCGHE